MLKIVLKNAAIKNAGLRGGKLRLTIEAPGTEAEIDFDELAQATADETFSATVTIAGKVQQALLTEARKKRGAGADDEGSHGRD